MGQPRRVGTQSARQLGLWRQPGHQLRTPAEPGPGWQLAGGRPYPGTAASGRSPVGPPLHASPLHSDPLPCAFLLVPSRKQDGSRCPYCPSRKEREAGVSSPLPSPCARVPRGWGLCPQPAQGSRPPWRLTLTLTSKHFFGESKCRHFPLPSISGGAGRGSALSPLSPTSAPPGRGPAVSGTESGDESQGIAVKGLLCPLRYPCSALDPGLWNTVPVL